MVLSMTIGLVLGSAAGFFRGTVDTVISRLTEITMAFPYLLFVIALAATVGSRLDTVTFGFLGQGVITLVVVFGLFSWFYSARVFRSLTLSLRRRSSSRRPAWSARATGGSSARTSSRTWSGPIVFSTLLVAQFILAEAGLSFLGSASSCRPRAGGTCSPTATPVPITRPELMVWPGIALILTTLAFNLLGDGLRDAFDPRGGGR